MNNPNSWVEVSSSALKYNISQFRKILPKGVKISAVIKSNAYGHDMIQTAKAITSSVDYLAVVSAEEALELRKDRIKKPILVLSIYFSGQIKELIKNNISFAVYDLELAKKINDIAKKINKKAKLHFKYDTGNSRLGVVGEGQALNILRHINTLENIELEGLFSHFAASEENQKFTDLQIQRFNSFIEQAEKINISVPLKHISSSAAVMVRDDASFDMMRLGISLYGLWPSKQAKRLTKKRYPKFNLKPALTWKTKIIRVKEIAKGASVGYGCTYKTTKKTKIAILPIGYWDGYDRHLSNKGEVLVQGKKCSIIGRVCMNLIMVDVSKIKNVKPGDEVVLLGKQGRGEVSAAEIAEKIGTINYEIITRINPLLPRKFI